MRPRFQAEQMRLTTMTSNDPPVSLKTVFPIWRPCHLTDCLSWLLHGCLWSPTLTPGGQQNTLILHREAQPLVADSHLLLRPLINPNSEDFIKRKKKRKRFFSCPSRFRVSCFLKSNKRADITQDIYKRWRKRSANVFYIKIRFFFSWTL